MTSAVPGAVWEAVRDVGALHTRLAPGFVVDTKLERRRKGMAKGMAMMKKTRDGQG